MPAVPAFVLTGFLGSGKTTLLRHLLADPGMKDTAVLINEFGQEGLDHLLVREVAEDVVLLSSGCLCCTVRDDLIGRLAELHALAAAGRIPAFSRAVIETTGLADPAPIMHALMSEPMLRGRYRLASVITTLDATHGAATLKAHREARHQLAVADAVVVTKTDLATAAQREELLAEVAHTNAAATILTAAQGRLHAGELLADARAAWKGYRAMPQAMPGGHHSPEITTFTIEQPAPVAWDAFVDWLELLLLNRGQSILRVKGLLDVEGNDAPTVVQGVQHVLFPPERLPQWPDARRGWLVFIAKDLTATSINASFSALCNAGATQEAEASSTST